MNDQLVEGLLLPGCALCRARAESERWEIKIFVREGRFSREGRPAFTTGGGYCQRHAWLLHAHVVELGTGSPIVDLYGSVLTGDRRQLAGLPVGIRELRRWRRLDPPLRRSPCLACTNVEAADERHAYFFMQALREPAVRRRYSQCDGLCLNHVAAIYQQTVEDDDREVAVFLLEETNHRLEALARRLAEYDRKRDVRYAAEPKDDEQTAWTDIIRLYVGEDFLTPLSVRSASPPGLLPPPDQHLRDRR